MSGRRKETSVGVRDLIIRVWEDKEKQPTSYRKLAKRFHLPLATVYKIIQRYNDSGSVANKPGRGRKSKLTQRQCKEIHRRVTIDPLISAPTLRNELLQHQGTSVSTQTIRNRLREMGFNGRRPRRKPFINKKNQLKRLNFARDHLSKPMTFWDNVLWSDESKINLFGGDGNRRVWRKPNEALKIKNITLTVKHGGGNIMVWGSMTSAGVGSLEFIDVRMNADVYVDLVGRNIPSSVKKLKLGRRYVFQQDNDPKHTSRKATDFFKKKKITVLPWPPQSPDLNPIEHLWGTLKKIAYRNKSSNLSELKNNVRDAWEEVGPEVTRRLVESMPSRLKAVIAANGGPTSY